MPPPFFDLRIVDYLADEFKKETSVDLRKDKLAALPQNASGEIDLIRLLSDTNFHGAIVDGRSYGDVALIGGAPGMVGAALHDDVAGPQLGRLQRLHGGGHGRLNGHAELDAQDAAHRVVDARHPDAALLDGAQRIRRGILRRGGLTASGTMTLPSGTATVSAASPAS